MPEANIVVRNLKLQYPVGRGAHVAALDGVSLDLTPGSLTLIMGPSGSGKTTLLSVLGCLLRPDQGSVSLLGQDVLAMAEAERTHFRRRHIGFIFQAFRLLKALPVLDNVLVAAEISGDRSRALRESAVQLLDSAGLHEQLTLKPHALSGGEKQRVAIARALLMKPAILLADEPTASLDAAAGKQVSEWLRRIASDEQRTVVVVSHDPRWMKFADQTIVLEDGRVSNKEGLQ